MEAGDSVTGLQARRDQAALCESDVPCEFWHRSLAESLAERAERAETAKQPVSPFASPPAAASPVVLSPQPPGSTALADHDHDHGERPPQRLLPSEEWDPRSTSDGTPESFVCPKCGRSFSLWHSCDLHKSGRYCSLSSRSLSLCLPLFSLSLLSVCPQRTPSNNNNN